MPDLREGCATGRHGEKTALADALVLFGAMGDLARIIREDIASAQSWGRSGF
jgi:hypothetical protein